MPGTTEDRSTERAKQSPSPDDPRKPDSPDDISKPGWKYIARKTLREFTADQCTDLAAALTYYGVLALFPALLAIVSLLGVFGDAQETTESILGLAGGLVPQDTLDTLRGPIERLTQNEAAGFGLVIGIVGALWSASGFVGAFARAMNRIYSIDEGRPFWKLRPMMLIVTLIAIVVAVLVAIMLVASGPIAESIGATIGLGSTAVTVWNIAKWLYYAAPNVKQPKFRWMSIGAFVALLVWAIASALFGLYVANFSSYNETYGSIGGVIVFLLWVWISNIALLFGAELDAEVERGRQLVAGIDAEETIKLPPRDTKKSDKAAAQHDKDVEMGRELRTQAERDGNDADDQRDDDTGDPKSTTQQASRRDRNRT
jgi:membrane protein